MICPNCSSTFDHDLSNCSKCGYPFSGTESERASFIAQQVIKVGDIDDAKKSVKNAKTILFVIGIINIASAFFLGKDIVSIGFGIIIGIIFIVFGFLVDKNPFRYLIIPLILLLMFYLIDAVIEPMSLVRGILWKIMYVTALVYGIVRVKRAEKIKSESEYLRQQ